jgi:3-hydroxyacyl-CoA dehydrogenase
MLKLVTQPIQREKRCTLGKQALRNVLRTDQMVAGKYISEHDKKIANKLAYVIGWW